MRNLVLLATAATFFAGCSEPEKSIHVTETRELTLFDRYFRGDYKDLPPLDWRRIPPTQFRLINYVGGKDESVQIFMGEAQGDVLGNANRWLGQFGLSELQSQEFLGQTELMGRPAYLVEGEGTFNPGMGREPIEDHGMIGVILPAGGNNIITLKMTGPAEEVESQREAFFQYMQSFTRVRDHYIEEKHKKEQAEKEAQSKDY